MFYNEEPEEFFPRARLLGCGIWKSADDPIWDDERMKRIASRAAELLKENTSANRDQRR